MNEKLHVACLGIPGCNHPIGEACDCSCHTNKEMFDEIVNRLVSEWESQGRSDEQKYGVHNFFTGKGGIELQKWYILKMEKERLDSKASVVAEIRKRIPGKIIPTELGGEFPSFNQALDIVDEILTEVAKKTDMKKEVKCKACNDNCPECRATDGNCWSCEDILYPKSK